jgi:hypothetical protein
MLGPATGWSQETHSAPSAAIGELLYNGIRLSAEWPPRSSNSNSRAVRPIPYLEHPPAVIPIDVGRQLFVDDFLIEKSDLRRTFHRPESTLKIRY